MLPDQLLIPHEAIDQVLQIEGEGNASHNQLPIPYEAIDRAFQRGNVIPFLGAGINFGHRPPGTSWKKSAELFLPSGAELSYHLAKMSRFPLLEDCQRTNLAKVASYYEEIVGRPDLCDDLFEVFAQNPAQPYYPLCRIHEYLARIPKLRLVITTNYDLLLEEAFKQAQRRFFVIIHRTYIHERDTVSEEARLGKVLWYEYDPAKASAPHQVAYGDPRDLSLSIDAQEATVIYKMHGTASKHLGDYIISEEDYMDFLTRMTQNTALPNVVCEYLPNRRFLFLGYGLGDWNTRVVLSELSKKAQHSLNKSWAIQFEPSLLEKKLWAKRSVEIFHADIDKFVEELTSVSAQ